MEGHPEKDVHCLQGTSVEIYTPKPDNPSGEQQVSLRGSKMSVCSCVQNERDVLRAGEAAQPPEAHHPEDGDHLRGGRLRRAEDGQRQEAKEESKYKQMGPFNESH